MTKTELKNLFGRFENLNLRVLMDDVRTGNVAFEAWVYDVYPKIHFPKLCPVAHGWQQRCDTSETEDNLFAAAGVPRWLGSRFIEWWDNESKDETKPFLLVALRELWDERLADAEAVQCLIHGEAAALVKEVMG